MEFCLLFLEVLSQITNFLMHKELLIQENQSIIRNSRVKLYVGNLGVWDWVFSSSSKFFVHMGIFWFIWSMIYTMMLPLNHSCSISPPPGFQADWGREHVHFCNFNWILELSSYTCFCRTKQGSFTRGDRAKVEILPFCYQWLVHCYFCSWWSYYTFR